MDFEGSVANTGTAFGGPYPVTGVGVLIKCDPEVRLELNYEFSTSGKGEWSYVDGYNYLNIGNMAADEVVPFNLRMDIMNSGIVGCQYELIQNEFNPGDETGATSGAFEFEIIIEEDPVVSENKIDIDYPTSPFVSPPGGKMNIGGTISNTGNAEDGPNPVTGVSFYLDWDPAAAFEFNPDSSFTNKGTLIGEAGQVFLDIGDMDANEEVHFDLSMFVLEESTVTFHYTLEQNEINPGSDDTFGEFLITTIIEEPVESALVDITKSDPQWLPEFGNSTTYTSRIYENEPGCPVGPAGIIRFTLSDVSNEKGICLNMGTRDAKDYHFNFAANHDLFVPVTEEVEECDYFAGPHEHWFAIETTTCVTEATAHVFSEDYGGFGFVEATAILDGRCGFDPPVPVTHLEPREPGESTPCVAGLTRTKIPRDENGNDIADKWYGDEIMGNSDPMWDEATLPNPAATSRGDGLTRYENYRGVYIQGGHRRLNPLLKHLFIYRENNAWDAFHARFAAHVHYVTSAEINGAFHDNVPGIVNPNRGPRIINFNHTSHTRGDQHGLWLAVGGGDGRKGNWGLARTNNGTTSGPIGPPRTAGKIEVYENNINDATRGELGPRFRYGRVRRGDARFFYTGIGRRREMILSTIGHEIGHCINLRHHASRHLTIRHSPGTSADGWLDVNPDPVTQSRDWTSAAPERTCVMAYSFPEIYQSVALEYTYLAGWYPISHNWTPTVPATAFGYGATCDVTGHSVCRVAIIIRDN